MIQEFITYLTKIKGYSENTALAYGRDLREFTTWAKSNLEDARWSRITRDDIDLYVKYMTDADLKPATTNRRLSAISSLYGFMIRQGLKITNPCKYESRRKIGERVPNTIPHSELQAAYEHSAGVVRVMLGILATTGIRIQELLDLQIEDIDFEIGSLTIKGKGSQQRIVYTDADKLETLYELKQAGHQGTIFDMTQRDARRMIWEALKPYSGAKQLSPHAIRHTFATNMARRGVNCSTLAQLLGHRDLNTTQKYIDLTQTMAQQVCLEYSLLH